MQNESVATVRIAYDAIDDLANTWAPYLTVSNRQAIVSVKDEGEGIPLSEQGRVFERFHRVANGLTRDTNGTGLGLYIAKLLADAMDGRLWLDSEPGRGCTFSLGLPLAEERDSRVWGAVEAQPSRVKIP